MFLYYTWNARVGNQEIPRITGKFGLAVQNEAQQSLTVLSREHAGQSKQLLPTTQEMTAPRHHQMVNTEIRLCSLQPKMEKLLLYHQQKQEMELTVAQIISYLLQNSASD